MFRIRCPCRYSLPRTTPNQNRRRFDPRRESAVELILVFERPSKRSRRGIRHRRRLPLSQNPRREPLFCYFLLMEQGV